MTLYEAHPALTLELSSLIITDLFKSRLSPLLKQTKLKETLIQRGTWEDLLRGMLNGVQVNIPAMR